MNFAFQCDYGGYYSCSAMFYYMCLDPFRICYIYAFPLITSLARESYLTLSLYSFDCCARITENPTAHSTMMLAVKESKIFSTLHALVDFVVRDLPRFTQKWYFLPKPFGQVHCSANFWQKFLLTTDC